MFEEMEGCIGGIFEFIFQSCMAILVFLLITFACIFFTSFMLFELEPVTALGVSGAVMVGFVVLGFLALTGFDMELPSFRKRRYRGDGYRPFKGYSRRSRRWDD
jgi:hypothetical protein